MQVELQRAGLKCQIECPVKVKYRSEIAGDCRADLFVHDVVIVGLKAAKNYSAEDGPQLLNELKATGIKVGLLTSFGRTMWGSNEWSFEPMVRPCSSRG